MQVVIISWERLRSILEKADNTKDLFVTASAECARKTEEAELQQQRKFFISKHSYSRDAALESKLATISKNMTGHANDILAAWKALPVLEAEYQAILAVKLERAADQKARAEENRQRVADLEETTRRTRRRIAGRLERQAKKVGEQLPDPMDMSDVMPLPPIVPPPVVPPPAAVVPPPAAVVPPPAAVVPPPAAVVPPPSAVVHPTSPEEEEMKQKLRHRVLYNFSPNDALNLLGLWEHLDSSSFLKYLDEYEAHCQRERERQNNPRPRPAANRRPSPQQIEYDDYDDSRANRSRYHRSDNSDDSSSSTARSLSRFRVSN